MLETNNKIELITQKIRESLVLLGLDIESEGLKDTPKRIAKMWVKDICANSNVGLEKLKEQMTLFSNENNNSDLIIMKNINFSSWCMHHFLPFSGVVSVGYIPDKHIIGLSKIPRVVKFFSKKPQIQENLGQEIANFLYEILNPVYVIVQIKATHTCVACRGAESDCETDTIHTKGHIPDLLKEKKNKEFLERVK